ncbi:MULTISPECIES: ATP-dependent DNA helicase RecQ [unclassified Arcicella]|uniref:RecQ family ATP-dependent DNA helicase n=1 Tax=unclassified Arcicella TaxID=2644986 RepID=UPI00285A1D20|nr:MULTISPECIES: ATP-dependent DNA helicase RecQ [unclassified Arcicella]MDR6564852.1 ATP-dependent DNA helicase RecQ [Arcicella sp. BE51]MDR6814619.1 ATP-dependent DNA helicase RecQ [Arcicella sp. BE140]MDR6826065.1 ATP-dependent DNA helicase RecQ [Arcicella sp. BE139]
MSAQEILKQYWGYDSFRPLQEDIIQSVMDGKDTLALMPTGGGKSMCFQIPALMNDGICIVVSPLIALIQDQVNQLKQRKISAIGIFSGMHKNQIDIALDNCIYGDVKFLYVSPERLQTTIFIERVKQMKVNLLAIDEAHCISQWGHDFRPPYLKIAEFKKNIPNVPLIALTATATKDVRQEILMRLEMDSPSVFQQSFARDNLSYSAFNEEDKERRLIKILQNVQGSSVVYVRNRRRTQEISDLLNKNNINTTFYHAGLSADERSKRQERWIKNQVRTIVATNAFGMGIDKPDVRSVIHIDLPDTLEAYYQEAGRAGRDGEKAYAVALFNLKDIESLEKNILQNYPPIELVKKVYQCLGNFFQLAVGAGEFSSFDFDLLEFQKRFDLPPTETYFALKVLENEGFIQLSDSFHSPSKITLKVDNRQLYDFQLRNPKYDSFIKLLLRMYGGELFSTFITISEVNIAKAYSIPLKEVETMLSNLEKFDLVIYDRQKDKPQVTFLTARYDSKTLPLQIQEIDYRKAKALQKAQAVAHYVQHETRCRTQILLEYFDEITDETCGICDNCLKKKKRNKQEVEDEDFANNTRQKIKLLLANGAMSLQLITQIMQPPNMQIFKDIIREMIADGEIAYDSEGNLKI